ncbi:hypothetical protein EVB87_004 [Rhizobium phage RHph_N28_1]|nr:hypothetical protein EVB87_004 [Rhizobium phage RHph_N28_1]QIG74032.1 hypothetical protein EVC07_004 [Rhizobium phage RHph_N42]
MTLEQLRAMAASYDKASQSYLADASDTSRSHQDRRMALTMAGIANMQLEAILSAIEITQPTGDATKTH